MSQDDFPARTARIKAGFKSAADLSRVIPYSAAHIRNVERDGSLLTERFMKHFCNACNCGSDVLLFRSGTVTQRKGQKRARRRAANRRPTPTKVSR